MRVLITGSQGFIGQNLVLRLGELPQFTVLHFVRGQTPEQLLQLVLQADILIHLAGENRPQDLQDFERNNVDLTTILCSATLARGTPLPIAFASSTQAELDNPYGKSKRTAEVLLEKLAEQTQSPLAIFRLPGVFGKGCKPNYNSVVATFCHHLARDLPIDIHDPSTALKLVYIDDVVQSLLQFIQDPPAGLHKLTVNPEFILTLGELAAQITAFTQSRKSLMTEAVGGGLIRALYATYLSYLPSNQFVYDLSSHADERGVFAEVLKTPQHGQISFFTAHPGVTRGGHYHHSKTEKFVVTQGLARFRFRNLLSNEQLEFTVSAAKPQVVESIPGWAHDLTNIGQEELIVLLWGSEVFDPTRPDTIPAAL